MELYIWGIIAGSSLLVMLCFCRCCGDYGGEEGEEGDGGGDGGGD